MNRRGFLRALGTGAAVGVVAPAALAELLAPKRTIFLPPHGGWYGASAEEIYNDITALFAKLLEQSSPIPYTNEGYRLVTESFERAIVRYYGETDAQLRARMASSIRVQLA